MSVPIALLNLHVFLAKSGIVCTDLIRVFKSHSVFCVADILLVCPAGLSYKWGLEQINNANI